MPAAEHIESKAAPYHIFDIDADHATEGVTATRVISAAEMPAAEHIESKVKVIPTTEVGSDISVMEGTFAQDLNDDAPLEDMADVHDSYDAVLADVQDQDAPAEIPELKVTSPTTKDASPTKTNKLISR